MASHSRASEAVACLQPNSMNALVREGMNTFEMENYMKSNTLRRSLSLILSAQLALSAIPAHAAFPELWQAAIPSAKAQSQASLSEIVDRYSSTGRMPVEDFKVLMDNDASFQEKLKILNDAKAGDRVYMMYYIHANDETTAMINKAMIDAARRGAKVHLMVDFLTNYNNLDMFNMMYRQGGSDRNGAANMDIRFFNPPTREIHTDVMYLTTNCLGAPSAKCREIKEEIVRKTVEAEARRNQGHQQHLIGGGHFFSRLFLAGLSAKSPDALRTAVLEGGTDPRANMAPGAAAPSEAEKKQLMEFMQILLGAKVLHQTTDKIKLALAMVLYGEKVGPIYEAINNTVPMGLQRETPSGKHWEEISQFTHHKLLARIAADGSRLEMLNGGRNLENSYHLNENLREMIHKYLFADTDVKMTVSNKASVATMEAAIVDLHNYREMVVRLDEVNRYLPVDYVKEVETVKRIIEEMKPLKDQKGMTADRFAAEVEARVQAALEGKAADRQRAEFEKMNTGIAKYQELAVARANVPAKGLQPDFVLDLDPEDKRAKVSYIENLPFREKDPGMIFRMKNALKRMVGLNADTRRQRERIYDPVMGQEARDNKNIHGLWIEWLKQEAAEAAAQKKVRTIYMHQGYLYMPANMVEMIARMMDGTVNSEYLELKIVTNSIKTTDLSPMNVLARHQLKALFEYYDQHKGSRGALRGLDLFEYNVMENGNKTSLHSKAMFSESRMFIGSANADVRSYETDTNNGVFVEDAPKTAKKMATHMESMVRDTSTMTNVTKYYRRNHSLMLQEDMGIVKELAAKYEKMGQRIAQNEAEIGKLLIDKMTSVYLMTGLIIDRRSPQNWLGRFSTLMTPMARPGLDGGGGAVGGSGGNVCAKIMLEASAGGGSSSGGSNGTSKMMNTRSEMLQKIQDMKSSEIYKQFDRINQLI